MKTDIGLEYVGFWARTVAAFVDWLILLIITMPLTYLFYGRIWNVTGHYFKGPMDVLINWVLPAVITLWLWSSIQATPGKLAMGARIVDARTGEAPSMGQFVLRYVGYFLAVLPLGLGIFWVGLDSRKQGWHDKLDGTVVVKPQYSNRVSFANTSIQARNEPSM